MRPTRSVTHSVNEYRYEMLTWPEIDAVVAQSPVILLPVGATEQHGRHLPLDVDHRLAREISLEVGRRSSGGVLVLPPVNYGYCHHVMDFPGTINIQMEHMINFCLDITKSVAYHGFKRIVLLNAHGSNDPLLQIVARKTNLVTDAVCSAFSWWSVAMKAFNEVRESEYPGGCAHACELETSMYLYLQPDGVRKEHIRDEVGPNVGDGESTWYAFDLAGGAPTSPVPWTSTYTESGVIGRPSLGTAEKGRVAFEGAVGETLRFCSWFRTWQSPPRRDRHRRPPSMELPFQDGI